MQLKPIDLKHSVNRLEDAIITLSGPCLAVSGILAGVDLVTGGHMMQSVGWLSLAWAITHSSARRTRSYRRKDFTC